MHTGRASSESLRRGNLLSSTYGREGLIDPIFAGLEAWWLTIINNDQHLHFTKFLRTVCGLTKTN